MYSIWGDPFPSGYGSLSRGVGMPYPSPFATQGKMWTPMEVRSLFHTCRIYFLTSPLVNAVITKMAAYPITELLYETTDDHVRDTLQSLMEDTIDLRTVLIEAGLDYFVFGNALLSVVFPFIKFLHCPNCKAPEKATRADFTFSGGKFNMTCKKCGVTADAKVEDVYVTNVSGIRIIRWNPEDFVIYHNPVTGERLYRYTVPSSLRHDIITGKRHVVTKTPQAFIESVSTDRSLVFHNDTLFHMKRPCASSNVLGRAWGVPIILPVLEDVFYLQMLRKAQECVSPNTLIETSVGFKRADDVLVGDLVRTHTGKWQPVEDKWYRDARPEEVGRRITVTSLRGISSVFSPHHPVLTIRRSTLKRRSDTKDTQRSSAILRNPHLYEEYICPTDKVNVGDYLLYPRYLPEKDTVVDVAACTGLTHTEEYVYSMCSLETAYAFEHPSNCKKTNARKVSDRLHARGTEPKRISRFLPVGRDLAYFMGWYAGDGACSNRSVTFYLGLGNEYRDLVLSAHNVFGVKATIEEHENRRVVSVNSTLVRKFVKGFLPGVALTKKTPAEILNGSRDAKLYYLKGLFEADGYVGENRAELVTISRELAYDAYRMLLHLGCIATIAEKEPVSSVLSTGRTIQGKNTVYSVCVCNRSLCRLLALWGGKEPLEVVSGKSGFFWKNYFATRVHSVEECQEDTYIDFKVSVDTTFCTPGIATKNSVASEHLIPLRILFPQGTSGQDQPFNTMRLTDWQAQVQEEITKWRRDRNYVPVLPVPIGNQTVAGDGRALLLHQEIRVTAEHIVAGMGTPLEFAFGGLCLEKQALTPTTHGIIEVGSLASERTETSRVITEPLLADTFDGKHAVTFSHNVGLKSVCAVKVRDGSVIRGAPTHPVLVLNEDMSLGWKNLEELTQGEYLVKKIGGEVWSKKKASLPFITAGRGRRKDIIFPTEMTLELASICGYLISEGHVDKERIRFANTDKEVVNHYQELFKKTFGIEPPLREVQPTRENCSVAWHSECWSRDLAAFFIAIGCDGNCYEKKIPDVVLQSPREYIGAFLQTYYEGDGGLCIKYPGSGAIRAVTTSKRLAGQLQVVLLNAGIASSVYPPSAANETYKIDIRTGVDRFASFCGFFSQRKKALLASLTDKEELRPVPYAKECINALKRKFPQHSWVRDFTPLAMDEEKAAYTSAELLSLLGKSDRELLTREIASGNLTPRVEGRRNIFSKEAIEQWVKDYGVPTRGNNEWPSCYKKHFSLQRLRRSNLSLVEEHDKDLYARFQRILEGDLLFEEVVSVTHEELLEEMVDLTVPGPDCYIANGFICHNSYAGTSVSLRMLENSMLNYRQGHTRFLRWSSRKISSYMSWPETGMSLRDFRMADDLNRQQYNFNLWNAGLLSGQDILEEIGKDYNDQMKKRRNEEKAFFEQQKRQMTAQAEAQVLAQKIQNKAQIEMQLEMQAMMPQQTMPAEGQAQQSGVEQQPGAEQQAIPQEQLMSDTQQQAGVGPLQQGGSPLTLQQGQNAAMTPEIGSHVSLSLIASQIAERLKALPPSARFSELAIIRKESAALADEVARLMSTSPQLSA